VGRLEVQYEMKIECLPCFSSSDSSTVSHFDGTNAGFGFSASTFGGTSTKELCTKWPTSWRTHFTRY